MKIAITLVVVVVAVAAGAWIFLGSGSQGGSQWLPSSQVPNSNEGAEPGSVHNLPVPAAVAAARTQAAGDAGVAESEVLILSAYEKEWSDGCLGLGGPAESCLAAITPGFEVTVEVEGQTKVYRTNEDGTSVREQQ